MLSRTLVIMNTIQLTDFGIIPIFRIPRRRKGGYEHKNQFDFYSLVGAEDEASEGFRKRYRFTENSVKAIANLLGDEIEPKAMTNNAFTAYQKMCIALRFYGTGSNQAEVGDGEGASQSSVCRIVDEVTEALCRHTNDLVVMSQDNEILNQVSTGFYGFKGSKFVKFIMYTYYKITL